MQRITILLLPHRGSFFTSVLLYVPIYVNIIFTSEKIEIEKTRITIRLLMDRFVYKFPFAYHFNSDFFSSIRQITVIRETTFEKIVHNAYF